MVSFSASQPPTRPAGPAWPDPARIRTSRPDPPDMLPLRYGSRLLGLLAAPRSAPWGVPAVRACSGRGTPDSDSATRNPLVYLDVGADGQPLGRVVLEVRPQFPRAGLWGGGRRARARRTPKVTPPGPERGRGHDVKEPRCGPGSDPGVDPNRTRFGSRCIPVCVGQLWTGLDPLADPCEDPALRARACGSCTIGFWPSLVNTWAP